MFGILIALLYAGYMYYTGVPVADFYPLAIEYLRIWYVICASVTGALCLVSTIFAIFGMPMMFLRVDGAGGALIGLVGGAIISILTWGWFIIKYGALFYGLNLLAAALNDGVWDTTTLIFGVIFLGIGIFLGGAKPSNGSPKKAEPRQSSYNYSPESSSKKSTQILPQDDLYHQCPHCRSTVINGSTSCPQCGSPQNGK